MRAYLGVGGRSMRVFAGMDAGVWRSLIICWIALSFVVFNFLNSFSVCRTRQFIPEEIYCAIHQAFSWNFYLHFSSTTFLWQVECNTCSSSSTTWERLQCWACLKFQKIHVVKTVELCLHINSTIHNIKCSWGDLNNFESNGLLNWSQNAHPLANLYVKHVN